MNPFVFLRWFIGIIFIVSAGEKLIGPYQNFLYVIESYAFIPDFLQLIVARVLPWIELFGRLPGSGIMDKTGDFWYPYFVRRIYHRGRAGPYPAFAGQ